MMHERRSSSARGCSRGSPRAFEGVGVVVRAVEGRKPRAPRATFSTFFLFPQAQVVAFPITYSYSGELRERCSGAHSTRSRIRRSLIMAKKAGKKKGKKKAGKKAKKKAR
jgi:hypothetical protein